MKKTTKIVAISVLAAIILLGVGYAAIGQITLRITGKATATANQDNFVVEFTDVVSVSDENNNVVAEIAEDARYATIEVKEGLLTQVNDSASATYEITNMSEYLGADFVVTVVPVADSVENKALLDEYFKISAAIADNHIEAGEKTQVTVTVDLIKTLIDQDSIVFDKIDVAIVASPTQPVAAE